MFDPTAPCWVWCEVACTYAVLGLVRRLSIFNMEVYDSLEFILGSDFETRVAAHNARIRKR